MLWEHVLYYLIYHRSHTCSSWVYPYRLPSGTLVMLLLPHVVDRLSDWLIGIIYNRVGNSLGGGEGSTARMVSQLGCFVGVGLSLLTGIVLYFAREGLASLFSGDDDVISYVVPSRAFPLLFPSSSITSHAIT
jgi:hypothetical protein